MHVNVDLFARLGRSDGPHRPHGILATRKPGEVSRDRTNETLGLFMTFPYLPRTSSSGRAIAATPTQIRFCDSTKELAAKLEVSVWMTSPIGLWNSKA